MSLFDRFTEMYLGVLRLLLANYPWHTGYGVLLGGGIACLVRAFQPALRKLWFVDLAAVPLWGWICLGLLIVHSLLLRGKLKHRPLGHEDVDRMLEVIERANFTPDERRQQYRLLIDRMAKTIALPRRMSSSHAEKDTP